jgi:cadmium resistance protein CadD (predicted permease)
MSGRRRERGGILDWRLLALFIGCVLMLFAAAAYMLVAALWFPVMWIPALLGVVCLAVGLKWTEELLQDRKAERKRRTREKTWIS